MMAIAARPVPRSYGYSAGFAGRGIAGSRSVHLWNCPSRMTTA